MGPSTTISCLLILMAHGKAGRTDEITGDTFGLPAAAAQAAAANASPAAASGVAKSGDGHGQHHDYRVHVVIHK